MILKRATKEEIENSIIFTNEEKDNILRNFDSEKKWGL